MSQFFFYLLILLLPVQLGYHFWPKESFVWGLKVDYLAPTVYLTDIVTFLIIGFWLIEWARGKRETGAIRGAGIKNYTSGVLQVQHLGKFLGKSERAKSFPIGSKIARLKFWVRPFFKRLLPFFLIFTFLLINCLLAKNQPAAFYKLTKIIEMGALAWYVKEKIGNRDVIPAKSFSSFQRKLESILDRFQIKSGMTEEKVLSQFLAISVFYSSVIAILQFLKQGSIGGLLWWLGERTFTAQTPGISLIDFGGRLFLRPYGTFPHPNVLGGFLAITLPVIFSSFLKRLKVSLRVTREVLKISSSLPIKSGSNSKIRGWFLIITFFLGLITLFLTFSRTAILAFLIMMAYIILRPYAQPLGLSVGVGGLKKKTFLFKLLSIVFLVFLATCYILLISKIHSPESITYRQQLTLASLRMIKDYPIFGVGLNNFIVSLPRYGPPGLTVRFLQPVHNIYFLIAAELGIPGLLLFLWLIFYVWKKCRMYNVECINKKNRQLYIINFTLFIILFLGLFDHYFLTLQQGQIMLAIILGLNLKDH